MQEITIVQLRLQCVSVAVIAPTIFVKIAQHAKYIIATWKIDEVHNARGHLLNRQPHRVAKCEKPHHAEMNEQLHHIAMTDQHTEMNVNPLHFEMIDHTDPTDRDCSSTMRNR